MNDPILSQEEIDALMAAIQAERDEAEARKGSTAATSRGERRIIPYDFLRPGKFSKDQIRTLQMLHETFARNLQTSLSAYLRSPVEVAVTRVHEQMYEEFSASLATPAILAVLRLSPLEGSAFLEIHPHLGFVMLDRLLGGPGIPLRRLRPLTEIEQTVMRRIVERVLPPLEEAWSQIIDLEIRFERLELNPQFTQLLSPKDMAVVVQFEIDVGTVQGVMNLCIPYSVLEPVSSKLKAQVWFAGDPHRPDPEVRKQIEAQLADMKLPIVVELGSGRITVGDFLDLGEGDVICLDTRADGVLPVRVGGSKKFLARPGVVGNRLAVQVTSVIRKGSHGDE